MRCSSPVIIILSFITLIYPNFQIKLYFITIKMIVIIVVVVVVILVSLLVLLTRKNNNKESNKYKNILINNTSAAWTWNSDSKKQWIYISPLVKGNPNQEFEIIPVENDQVIIKCKGAGEARVHWNGGLPGSSGDNILRLQPDRQLTDIYTTFKKVENPDGTVMFQTAIPGALSGIATFYVDENITTKVFDQTVRVKNLLKADVSQKTLFKLTNP